MSKDKANSMIDCLQELSIKEFDNEVLNTTLNLLEQAAQERGLAPPEKQQTLPILSESAAFDHHEPDESTTTATSSFKDINDFFTDIKS